MNKNHLFIIMMNPRVSFNKVHFSTIFNFTYIVLNRLIFHEIPKFKNTRYSFIQSISKKYNDFTHIDDRLCKDFLPGFLSLLDKYKPSSNSLGLRVKTLIETDIIKIIDQLEALASNSDFCSTQEFQLNKEIISASSQYIVELEEIVWHSYETRTYIYGW